MQVSISKSVMTGIRISRLVILKTLLIAEPDQVLFKCRTFAAASIKRK